MKVHTGRMQAADDLIRSNIVNQAADLERGWREGSQNGVDSTGSTVVELEYSDKRTVIRDNGDGVDLSPDGELDLLTFLGLSSKDSDSDDTIGEFGLGEGQMIAKGHVTMMSGDWALHFDIKQKWMETEEGDLGWLLHELEKPVDGFIAVINHYPDEVPREGSRRWDRYERSIKKRFRHVKMMTGVEVRINGEVVSDKNPEDMVGDDGMVCQTDDAYFALESESSSKIDVYSNGVFVKEIDGEGLTGTVISKGNLDLTQSRDNIKSGCEKWNKIKDDIDNFRVELLKDIESDTLGEDTRSALVHMAREDRKVKENLYDKKLISVVDGDLMSIQEVESLEEVGYDEPKRLSDKVTQHGAPVLDQNDSATQVFVSDTESSNFKVPSFFNTEEKAEEMNVDRGYKQIHDVRLSSKNRRRMCVARALADELGIRRDIIWGEDDGRRSAWTDGATYIALTKDVFSSNLPEIWLPKLYRTLIHEWVHNSDNTEGKTHGSTHKKRFERKFNKYWHDYEKFAAEVHENGLTHYEPDGLTEKEKERRDDIENSLGYMVEGDEFHKNRERGTATVIDPLYHEDEKLRIEGPRGGTFEIEWGFEDKFPQVTSMSSGNSYGLWHLEMT